MSRGVNTCHFIGHLGNNADQRFTSTGKSVVNFSIACSEQWKNEHGDKQERTEWVNCVLFGKLGEAVAQYLTKGSQVYVVGKLRTEKWQDRDGKDRYTTKIYVDDLTLLGGGRRDEGGQRQQGRGEQQTRSSSGAARGGSQRPNTGPPDDGGFDDDIPF